LLDNGKQSEVSRRNCEALGYGEASALCPLHHPANEWRNKPSKGSNVLSVTRPPNRKKLADTGSRRQTEETEANTIGQAEARENEKDLGN